ncbi:hypothetical protein CVU82_01740 [Candidatus Falkowbacteria bacterium HGW-Falkowbacteria-1]|uniref:Uncharacterized protein n=1 Tax=Candidatus Falkowbacteria bacterium HGW-Falkowbacteria-1 TaxID=2013768 RepID=A0A2N2E9A5_9BACT|nr:MAG: hypothetical protein CVU82_01740 [Candidatus Falkowbacteria bacterium HGW-Falkowbacteria-1]
MKSFLKVLLIVLITIVAIIIFVFSYVIIKNPLGIGDVVKSYIIPRKADVNMEDYADYDNPLLTDAQEEKIIKAGIDIRKIPTEITPEQQKCGVEKLGEERILEIVNGAEPSPTEMLKVLPCL